MATCIDLSTAFTDKGKDICFFLFLSELKSKSIRIVILRDITLGIKCRIKSSP